jgi:hypothetical protein
MLTSPAVAEWQPPWKKPREATNTGEGNANHKSNPEKLPR